MLSEDNAFLVAFFVEKKQNSFQDGMTLIRIR